MLILGIETSCDETAASVVNYDNERIAVLSNIISSQIDIHKKYGGVIPEVAAREHVQNILPVITEALEQAGVAKNRAADKLGALAVTIGPGLITSLQVGIETAKALSWTWDLPVAAVNHIEGHIAANFIDIDIGKIEFPAVVLTVSGGHTILALMKAFGEYEILGQTRDDAAGEAYDKAAQMLGVGYPGGPAVAARATQAPNSKHQILNKSQIQNSKTSNNISLPRPMVDSPDLDFSFSGLKTALLYEIKKDKNYKKRIDEYCLEFDTAVSEVLVKKTIKAALKYDAKTVMLAGGVAANSRLRDTLAHAVGQKAPGARFLKPDLAYTTDNAAMIAAAGAFRAKQGDFTPWQKLQAKNVATI